jgi:hypothetical protein
LPKAVAFGETLQDEFFTVYQKLKWQKRSLKVTISFQEVFRTAMMLIDLRNKGISKEAENALVKAEIQ